MDLFSIPLPPLAKDFMNEPIEEETHTINKPSRNDDILDAISYSLRNKNFGFREEEEK